MSEPVIPTDLLPMRAAHDPEVCDCDLEGGDSECGILPPFESTKDYCERLRGLLAQTEANHEFWVAHSAKLEQQVTQQAATISTLAQALWEIRGIMRTSTWLDDLEKIGPILQDVEASLHVVLASIPQEKP
jgi:hypothetical protein